MTTTPYTLKKEERLCSRKLIGQLFQGTGSHALTAYPLRLVYMAVEASDGEAPLAQVMVSVSKRYFKRAVKRNRVKRQIREAYRKNKQTLLDAMASRPSRQTLCLAFIWLDSNLHDSRHVERKVVQLLQRLEEKL